MTTRFVPVFVQADEDQDDCLAAAAAAYIEDHPALRGWDLSARFADDDREVVELIVPEWAT